MKKEIMNVVKSENGSINVTPFGILSRWTKDAIGAPVDRLSLTLSVDKFRVTYYEIKSREYENIIEEIEDCIRDYFDTVSTETRSAFLNGRLN